MWSCGAFGPLALLLAALSAPAAAQGVAQPRSTKSQAPFQIAALSAEQERELTQWLSAIKEWQQYESKWRNRPVRDGWGRVVERKAAPLAPAWLAARCAWLSDGHVPDLEPRTALACRLLEDPRLETAQIARLEAEMPPKHSSFLRRIHVDMLATQSRLGTRMYGIVGMHVTLVDVGRFHMFGPPGVLLVTVPAGNGGRRVTFGYTWGVSVRLTDIRLGGRAKNMTLFLNISKVWLNTGTPDVHDPRGYDIIGFSIAPRRQR